MSDSLLHEKLLREYVGMLLLEAYDDIVDIQLAARLSLKSVNLSDILTDIRGIKNVITVNQETSLNKVLGQEYTLLLTVSYEQDGTISQEEIIQSIQDITGVNTITFKGSEKKYEAD